MKANVVDIAARFTCDTSEHQLTVLRDDGLYRHLRFRSTKHGVYWFDLITIPGTLIFQGDGISYVFSRIEDMFAFFRGPVGRINPGYWSQKLTSCRQDDVKVYDEEIFRTRVREKIAEALEADPTLIGLPDAVGREILDSGEIGFENEALRAVSEFVFYVRQNDRYDPGKSPDFQFYDTWEWDCRDYYWWFLWACHAIVWGIAQYDGVKGVSNEYPRAHHRPRSGSCWPGGALAAVAECERMRAERSGGESR